MSAQGDLVPHYVDYLRARSQLATRDDYGALELAAHLFAVGEQLFDDGHDLPDPAKRREVIDYGHDLDSLERLGSVLARLPREISVRDLYGLLIDALWLIESVCCTRHDEGYEPSPIEIPEIEVEGRRRLLGGRVILWVRRSRILRRLRQEAFDVALETETSFPPSQLERPSRRLDRLFCHWKRDNRVPEIIRAAPEDVTAPLLSECGRGLGSGDPVLIALCPLVGEAHPLFVVTEDCRSFRTCNQTPMIESPGHSIREQLETILALAREKGVHLVVLPELSVDPASRDWLGEVLSRSRSNLPMGVVAGSFHFDKQGSPRPHNESHFLDGSGLRLLEHHKRGRFRMTRKQLEEAAKKGLFRDPERLAREVAKNPSSIPAEIEEHIEPGGKIHLLEAAVGQMAVLICADAIDKKNRRGLRDAVEELRPDFVLLPSMSLKTDRFDEFMTTMEDLGTATFFVNAHSICRTDQTLAAVCLDLFQRQGDLPTRVRWRASELEVYDRGGQWKNFDPAGSPFDWLSGSQGQRLGLLVDLGAYWRQPPDQRGRLRLVRSSDG